ncbi:endo-1,4-beta-xylanase [Anditalea andensis]|nr:endo-1,4-beta-xylanase [Anditalea andensis]
MYLKQTVFIFLLAFSLSCVETQENNPLLVEPEEETAVDQVIRHKAAFNVGAAVTRNELNSASYANTLKTHYSQITAEYEMKMAHIWNGVNNYNWTNADALVKFAEDNDMEVHGHTLVWYKSFPNWFKNANYDSASFEGHVKTYIETVVGRYKGKIISWDVANEIFLDNGGLRSTDCPVFKTFKDPVAFYGRCYRYAREADPEAKLFYNDYNVVLAGGKRGAMRSMATRFKSEGYPLDGIGDQMHYMETTNRNTIKNGLADMALTGLLIHISELDIRINTGQSDNFVYSTTEQQKHANAYKEIVEAYEAIPQSQKFAISTWGLHDGSTWLTDWWHPKEYPLLFDDKFEKKLTYEGFLNGLK